MGSPFTQNKILFFPWPPATSLTPFPVTAPPPHQLQPSGLLAGPQHTTHTHISGPLHLLPPCLESSPSQTLVHSLPHLCWHITSLGSLSWLLCPHCSHLILLCLDRNTARYIVYQHICSVSDVCVPAKNVSTQDQQLSLSFTEVCVSQWCSQSQSSAWRSKMIC